MPGQTAFDLIEATWFSISDNFDDLRQKAPDAAARAQLLRDRDAAKAAWLAAVNKAFDEQDQAIKTAKQQLADVTKDLKAELADLQDIVAALGLVTSAVKFLTALVGLA